MKDAANRLTLLLIADGWMKLADRLSGEAAATAISITDVPGEDPSEGPVSL